MTANESSLGGMENDRKCAHFQMQLYAKIFKFTAKNINNWQQITYGVSHLVI